MDRKRQHWVIIPAAGVGRRFGGQVPKQYRSINKLTVLEHSVKPFLEDPLFKKVLIAVSPEDQYFHKLRSLADHPKIITVVGGETRSASVLNALKALPIIAAPHDWVLVHDAVRPCLLSSDICKLIKEVGEHEFGGILSAPVADSLKQVHQLHIVQDIDRNTVWRALTPQMFRLSLLMEGLTYCFNHKKTITDEASAVEAIGAKPKIVAGHPNNLKITWEADLAVAEALILFHKGAVS
ncbi:MAG: 2-C-methyl-D-erythritol 4-phosphate cytidylyltransferase [Gammaproteobacteria bacterium]